VKNIQERKEKKGGVSQSEGKGLSSGEVWIGSSSISPGGSGKGGDRKWELGGTARKRKKKFEKNRGDFKV